MGFKEIVKRFLGYRGTIATATVVKEGEEERRLSGYRFYLDYLIKDRVAAVALAIITLFTAWSIVEGILQYVGFATRHRALGWALLPSNPIALNFAESLKPPSLSHFPVYIFGTNFSGESILSRLLYAAPKDALAAYLVVFSGIIIGMLVGTFAGYFGGWADEVLMRVTDAFLALPGLVLAIALSVLLGSGYNSVLISLTLIWWPTYARFFRAQALSLKSRGFVEASKLSGQNSIMIILRHIFPNSVDPVIAYAALDFGNVILTYSTLAFLGIGIQPPYPEWGSMSSNGLPYFPQNWWWSIIPGLVIMTVVVCFTLIGDRMQDLIGGRLTY
ncbi:peptide ABC transporter permease [Candidatus Marsarchaeota G2 archaeon OSP_D]|uniref:Peptide ABC transporter permease n=1 Tax=Candidatus Marsarchaeota G2 archaeon OSP_D TaxID=1978157 RepID=A0A2R6AU19_9ARCH|nr:MAG: peptide ABC transporter permease [Candidatus Marsarchaeota G2 archaeon OSP_D]